MAPSDSISSNMSKCPLVVPIYISIDHNTGSVRETLLWRLGDPRWDARVLARQMAQHLHLPVNIFQRLIEEQIQEAIRPYAHLISQRRTTDITCCACIMSLAKNEKSDASISTEGSVPHTCRTIHTNPGNPLSAVKGSTEDSISNNSSSIVTVAINGTTKKASVPDPFQIMGSFVVRLHLYVRRTDLGLVLRAHVHWDLREEVRAVAVAVVDQRAPLPPGFGSTLSELEAFFHHEKLGGEVGGAGTGGGGEVLQAHSALVRTYITHAVSSTKAARAAHVICEDLGGLDFEWHRLIQDQIQFLVEEAAWEFMGHREEVPLLPPPMVNVPSSIRLANESLGSSPMSDSSIDLRLKTPISVRSKNAFWIPVVSADSYPLLQQFGFKDRSKTLLQGLVLRREGKGDLKEEKEEEEKEEEEDEEEEDEEDKERLCTKND